jgi:glycosyltransferase involved in cell wall biosynthesis
MPRLSLYTFVRNGLYFDFHVEAMLRHHLPLADEIIVDEGLSTDGTYEAIRGIDPKIKIFRNEWDRSDPLTWHIKFKNRARQNCTGDWCILLDCDEFIPEWEFERLREAISSTDQDIFAVRMLHFYGNYKVHQARTDREFPPKYKRVIHRNIPTIEVWGDGSDVRNTARECVPGKDVAIIDVHHFGEVRHAARLRQKWRTQARQHNAQNPRWDFVPGFVFDLFPHRWADPEILPHLHLYEGPYIQAVRDNPKEFVRDNFALVKALERRQQTAAAT